VQAQSHWQPQEFPASVIVGGWWCGSYPLGRTSPNRGSASGRFLPGSRHCASYVGARATLTGNAQPWMCSGWQRRATDNTKLRHSREVTLVCSPKVTHLAGLNGPFGARQRRVFGARQTPLRAKCRRSRRSRHPAARGSPCKVRALHAFGADDGESARTPSAWMILLVPSLPCAKSCSQCGSF